MKIFGVVADAIQVNAIVNPSFLKVVPVQSRPTHPGWGWLQQNSAGWSISYDTGPAAYVDTAPHDSLHVLLAIVIAYTHGISLMLEASHLPHLRAAASQAGIVLDIYEHHGTLLTSGN